MTATSSKAPVPVSRGDNPIRSLQSSVNRLFDDFFGDLSFPAFDRLTEAFTGPTPAVDVAQGEKAYTVSAELPGMEAGDVQVSAADGYLTIKGEKTEESSTEHDGYVRKERSYGSFQRVIALPKDADFDDTKAELHNGLLTVTVARKPEAATAARRINVREVA